MYQSEFKFCLDFRILIILSIDLLIVSSRSRFYKLFPQRLYPARTLLLLSSAARDLFCRLRASWQLSPGTRGKEARIGGEIEDSWGKRKFCWCVFAAKSCVHTRTAFINIFIFGIQPRFILFRFYTRSRWLVDFQRIWFCTIDYLEKSWNRRKKINLIHLANDTSLTWH